MRGPKPKPRIVCQRCNREAQPVRKIYCRNCASVLVTSGKLERVLVDNTPRTLTEYQEQVLNGLMLGDGCLYRRKSTHKPYLAVQRSQDDRGYLIENYGVFKDFCKREAYDGETFDKRTGKINYWSKFVTRRCEVFKKYYDIWYPNGTKIVPVNFELTPLTAAIWFADNGYFRFSSCGKSRLQLSSESFQKKDVQRLADMLSLELNAKFSIQKNLRIHAYGENADMFFNYIDSVFPKTMQRKALWKVG